MKLFKKLFPCIIAVAVVLICAFALPTETKAAEVASGTCGTNLTWFLDDAGTLTISGTGVMNDYSYLSSYPSSNATPWDSCKDSIKKIIVTHGVTTIGNSAFHNCTNLTSISIPDSVTEIGPNAFYNCTSLTSITIPDSVTNINGAAFYGCTGLTNVTIGHGVSGIGEMAFAKCSSLTSITIPDGVKKIFRLAFADCSSLTSITIPDSVTNIGIYAFMDCTGLTDVTIGNGISNIDSQFRGCINLTCITIPDSVTRIYDESFDQSNSLWHVLYTGTSDQWNTILIGEENDALTQAIIHYECTGHEVLDSANKICSICLVANCTHTYDNACDSECNICGTTRSVSHSYNADWIKDSNNHWHECSICGDKKDVNIHTPGAEATETTAQTCTTCGYVIKAALDHTHTFATTWTTDNNGHWHVCAGCSEKNSYAAHTWKGNNCSVCGANNPNATQPTDPTESSTEPSTNPTEHSTTPTEPSEPSTQPSEPSTPTIPDTEPSSGATEPSVAPTEPQEPVDNDEDGNNTWIVLLVVGIVFVAGGLAAVVVIAKKKR